MKIERTGWLSALTLLALACGSGRLSAQQSPAKPFNPATANYSRSESFPDIFAPYFSPLVPEPKMSNSQLLEHLIQNGQLKLSLQDALALALQNNLSIEVSRYSLAYAQTDILRTKSGNSFRGINPGLFGGVTSFATASSGGGGAGTGNAGGITGGGGAVNTGVKSCCDPVAGISFGWDRNTTPLNSIVVTGVPKVTSQVTDVTTFFTKGFLTGTSFTAALSGIRESSTSGALLFNPEVPTGMTLGFNQELLSGFGYRANAKFIRIANNDVKEADSMFRQQVMTTVAQVLDDYYDLLYDKKNVAVAQQAVAYAQRLLSDNKKQVEIGTLAPIEVVRAESEVATDQQNLVVAQTTYLQQQELLKTLLSKHVDPDLAAAAIDATDTLPEPSPSDIPSLATALQEAEKNRPEITQAEINTRNQQITIKAAKNALLPTFDIFGTYSPTGLSGNSLVFGNCPAGTIRYGSTCYVPGQTFPPTLFSPVPVVGSSSKGLSQSLTQVFHGNYPNYSFGATLLIPIRNRSGQADMATALLQERQLETTLQQTRNQVDQDVRNAEIGVTQARVRIDAAKKATELEKETVEAERKKFQLGESTVFNVIQTERDYVAAQGTESQAYDNYAKALVAFYQATGTTLDKFNIQLADAKTGQIPRVPNIPGTPTTASGQ